MENAQCQVQGHLAYGHKRQERQGAARHHGGSSRRGTINVVKRRLESLFRFNLVSRDPKLSITSHVIDCLHDGKVVLVDTSNMYEAEELLISTVLSRAIFERHKTLYGEKAKFDKVPPVLIALEEAQRVLTEAKGTIFAQIAREGRKFKTDCARCRSSRSSSTRRSYPSSTPCSSWDWPTGRTVRSSRNSAKQDISQLDNDTNAHAWRGAHRLPVPHRLRGAGQDPPIRGIPGEGAGDAFEESLQEVAQ